MRKKDQAKYKEHKKKEEEESFLTTCLVCGETGITRFMQSHHPCGRAGTNAFKTIRIHGLCHRWVHENVKIATQLGFLWRPRNTREITDGEWAALLNLMSRGERVE